MMFGYATNETNNYMSYSIYLANKLSEKLTEVYKSNKLKYLRLGGKTQVTILYDDDDILMLQKDIKEHVIDKVVSQNMIDDTTKIYINLVGKFILGGPVADSGLTGRKIIVDTYGGMCSHGVGAFSSKDPSKVDRSGSYYARYVAKNIVAAGLCKKIEIQVSYAIGISKPVSLYINTNTISEERILDIINKVFNFEPSNIIDELDLMRPIYHSSTCFGHFNKEELPWKKLNKVDEIKSYKY